MLGLINDQRTVARTSVPQAYSTAPAPTLNLSPALPARQTHGFELLYIKISSANDNADMRHLLKCSPSHQGPPLAR